MAAAVRSVPVRAGPHRYEALIGAGLLEETGALVRRVLRGPRCAVLADANVAPLFAARVLPALERAEFSAELITIPPGEASKSFAQVENLCAQLGAAGLDRSSFLISLGGGMVGDLAGFVASIFLRDSGRDVSKCWRRGLAADSGQYQIGPQAARGLAGPYDAAKCLPWHFFRPARVADRSTTYSNRVQPGAKRRRKIAASRRQVFGTG